LQQEKGGKGKKNFLELIRNYGDKRKWDEIFWELIENSYQLILHLPRWRLIHPGENSFQLKVTPRQRGKNTPTNNKGQM
jgi:hypothetical protein